MKILKPNSTPYKKHHRLMFPANLSPLKPLYLFGSKLLLSFLLILTSIQPVSGQCDAEVSGVFAYCNSFIGNNVLPGYFIGFRITSTSGDTFNVIDLAGNVPMNLGKRIDDINTQQEPPDTTRVPVRIAGGLDSLEYWYFGPFTDGDSFNIVLVDPTGLCDTIEVAAGTFTCAGQDPNACGVDVPLYVLDFSETSFNTGGGGGGNENVDDVFLVMSREREASCCYTTGANERCFEFIITLDEDDIGIVIDDVGSGSTGGKIYADSLNGFGCGPDQSSTWPYLQDNGNSADVEPLCLFAAAREWIVLTCKQGANITSASIGTVGSPNILPEFLYSDCQVDMYLLNADSAVWSSPDDPNLDNLINFTDRNISATFKYDTAVFGQVTSCLGDTFVYYVGGYPLSNSCLPTDTLVMDSTFVVVYPPFDVEIDSICNGIDSLILVANIISSAIGCEYSIRWSTGDTTSTIVVPNMPAEYSVMVERTDLDSNIINCNEIRDNISIEANSIECISVPDIISACVDTPPGADTTLITVGGCGLNPFIYSFDASNDGGGCPDDSLIITRYYIVDYDGDTISTSLDRDTCIQRFIYVDDEAPIFGCPPDITIECTDSTLPEFTGGTPVPVDNCDLNPSIGYTDVITAGACPQEYTITRTWLSSDACSNMRMCEQTITVDDSTPPVVSCPPNITINCTASTLPASTGIATGSDICDPSVTITFSNSIVNGICPQERTINRTWTATDDCGNTSTCVQVITVDDFTPPVINCPPNITIQCSASTNPNNTGSATAFDNCDLSVVPVILSDSITPGSCPQQVTINRTWRATDDCGNTSTCVQTITLVDNTAPVLSCPPNITIQCSASTLPATTGNATGIDNCDATPNITYTDVSVGGACPQERTITRTWLATDDCGNSSSCVQTIFVYDNTPPIIACPANVTLSCIQSTLPASTGTATASDNCDLNADITYTETITPSLICPQEYIITRTWQAIDDCGNSSTCNQIITIDDSSPPVINCPENLTVDCNANTLPDSTGSATAIDICDSSPDVSYTDSIVSGTCPVAIINRTWLATDDCGNTSTCIQIITVDDNTAPVITCPINVTINCHEDNTSQNTGVATAVDNCSTVTISQSQTTTRDPDPDQCGHYTYTITRTWTATDGCGNTSSCIQFIQVQDITPPVIMCPADSSPVECSASPVFGSATAVDNCSEEVEIIFSTTTIPGSCPQEYSMTRTWTATDKCGNSSTCSSTITVEDNTPPVIFCQPVTSPIECSETPVFPEVMAVDECDTLVTVTYTTTSIPGTCDYEYTLVRTWTATDDCGNTSTCSASIEVEDNTPPVISCPTVVSPVECPSTPSFGTATATDNCDTAVTITFSTITIPGPCSQEYTLVRTWIASDDCGNTSSCSASITVQDTTPPVINCPIVTSPINCPANPIFPVATATDNCDPTVTITFSTMVTPGPCTQERTVTRTWTATDDCGNSATCSRSVIVEDNTPPVITCPEVVSPIECTSVPVFGDATASDACDVSVTISFETITTPGSCPQEYSITRIWTATDDCGNSSTCSRTIVVEDTTPPEITCPTVDTLVECPNVPVFGTAIANDACDTAVQVAFVTDTIEGSCPQEYTIIGTWTATDNCGNSATCSRTITVSDTSAPLLSCPADTVINCTENTLPANTGTSSASDNCDLDVAVTYTDATVNGSCPQNYTINRTWLATDLCGNTSSCLQVITVQDTTKPVIACVADTVINCTENTLPGNTGTSTATDNCDLEVAVTYSDATVNGSCPQNYTINRTWLATDLCGNTSSCLQVITVQDTTKPMIICPPDTIIDCVVDTSPSNLGFATGIDECGLQNCEQELIDEFDVTFNGAYSHSTPILEFGTPFLVVFEGIYHYSTTRYVDNAYGITPVEGEFWNDHDGRIGWNGSYTYRPTPDIYDGINHRYNNPFIGDGTSHTFTFSDCCYGDNGGTVNVKLYELINCPEGVDISYNDSIIYGSCVGEYIIERMWQATDDCGNTNTCVQVITVQDTTKPVMVCVADTVINCTENTLPVNTGTSTATDNCDLEVAVTYTDATVNGSCPQNYTINRTWLATDECGNTSSCLQVITVQDTTKPVIVCVADTLINCTENTLPANTGTSTATDNCDLEVAVTYTDATVNGSCPQNYTINRTWVATDECGNTSSCLQVITVQDTTKPVIVCVADTLINCTENTLPANTGTSTATDNCDLDVAVTYTDATVNGSCPQNYTINRTWVATDECGNTSSCLQVITVQDTTKPVIACPANITITYPASTLPENTGSASTTDNCDTMPAITYSDSTSNELCPIQNLIYRTWVATDACGNSSTCLQIILIEDFGSICGNISDDLGNNLSDIVVQLITDINANGVFDGTDTLVSDVSTDASGNYCFTGINPCTYVLVEIQPVTYGDLDDYDHSPDPDGDDSADGPDNEIPVILDQGEVDEDNHFKDIRCPTILPVIPPDTICEDGSVEFETIPLNPGPLTYTWDFGSGSTPSSAMGLGPHTASYVTTTDNQMGGAIITLTVSKPGCPDLSGQVSTVDINPFPNPAINGSTSNMCYYTNRTFKPVANEIPGATYSWNFGSNAVPLTATGYGPHTVYYTTTGAKVVKLVIHPNEAGAQCPDSSSITFNITNCPANITGFVRSVSGVGIQGVNVRAYSDNDLNGIADNGIIRGSAFTTQTGSYSLVGLIPGSYVVIQTQPPGWFTVEDVDTTEDGDAVPNVDPLDNLIPATVGPSEIDNSNMFIEIAAPGSISGTVFLDNDNDEFPDADEGIQGVVIELFADTDLNGEPDSSTPIDTAITAANGNYSFIDVSIGNYVLIESQPSGYESVKDFDSSNDQDSVSNSNTLDDIIPVTVFNQENDIHNYFIERHECDLLVSNNNDEGEGSLRFMIDCASTGDTITFDSSLEGDTIVITSTKIEIDQNIVIQSLLSPTVTISSAIDGLFEIAPDRTVEFKDIEIISGISGSTGAAFYNFGILKLHNINILKNLLLPPSSYLILNSVDSQLIFSGSCNLNE